MAERALGKASRRGRSRDRTEESEERTLNQEIAGIVLLSITALLFLALVSFRPVTEVRAEAANWIGPAGAGVADAFYYFFGLGAYSFVFLLLGSAVSVLFNKRVFGSVGHAFGAAVLLVSGSGLLTILWPLAEAFGAPVGGLLGQFVGDFVGGVFGRIGAVIILLSLVVISGIMVTQASMVALTTTFAARFAETFGPGSRFFEFVRNLGGMISSFFRGLGARAQNLAGELRGRAADAGARRRGRRERSSRRAGAGRSSGSGDEGEDEDDYELDLADEDEDDEPALISGRDEYAVGTRGEASANRTTPDPTELADPDERLGAATSRARDEATESPQQEPEPQPIPIKEPPQRSLDDMLSQAEELLPFGDDAASPTKHHVIDNPLKSPTRPVPTSTRPQEVVEHVGGEEAQGDADDQATVANAAAVSQGVAEVVDVLDGPEEPADTFSEASTSPRKAAPQITESEAQKNRRSSREIEREALVAMKAEQPDDSWQYPSLSFLNYEEPDPDLVDKDKLRETAERLEQVLEDFKVKGSVTNICPGPVVTRFEFEPEAGTRVSKISRLSDDIAMALRAEKVRIIAPIPGKGCVGFEVPNDYRETVYLKEILASSTFTKSRKKLTMAMGKDIEGFPVVANLAKMPHLLVAGTTGSGKSVSVNSMIVSLLYNASPDEVQLILIDPKQLEFAIYEDIPHLLLPVVTDPTKAATALQWAVTEMERRYKLMKELRVRNVEGYNERLEKMQAEYEDYVKRREEPPTKLRNLLTEYEDDDRPRHRRMPYIVVVVDEFADLMMVAGKDVETAVARLAQKARAAGIHCILATQRPSVDVLTGLIKANFPTRLSCRLMSGVDSRTVLDTMGAENLLGMGDMLFRPPGSSELNRVHGAFVDEDEIEKICAALKAQRPADYDESILLPSIEEGDDADEDVDEKYDEAIACVVDAGYASISMVQRKLRVGYNRAARMVDMMEREGVIGPATGGSSRREVLVQGH